MVFHQCKLQVFQNFSEPIPILVFVFANTATKNYSIFSCLSYTFTFKSKGQQTVCKNIKDYDASKEFEGVNSLLSVQTPNLRCLHLTEVDQIVLLGISSKGRTWNPKDDSGSLFTRPKTGSNKKVTNGLCNSDSRNLKFDFTWSQLFLYVNKKVLRDHKRLG